MSSPNDNLPNEQEEKTAAPVQDTETQKTPARSEKHWIDYATISFELIGLVVLCVYAVYTIKIYRATKQSADAATSAAKTAANSLVLAQRPWIKINHRIVTPLTFDVLRGSGPVAMMTVEDTLENVGQSVALNVFSWEDIIPMDTPNSFQTARARQAQWCDANRNQIQSMSGDMLFPKDPFVQQSTIGPMMSVVYHAANSNTGDLRGKAAFILVGCVVYKSSFEPLGSPTHQTRFMYWLGEPSKDGGFNPWVVPMGVADKLRLIMMSEGFSAD